MAGNMKIIIFFLGMLLCGLAYGPILEYGAM
jgi:hypothetical protein